MFKGYGQPNYEHRVGYTIPCTFAYTSNRFDRELNHYYTKYRYYNPTTLRWFTRAPLGMAVSPKVYAYVRGNVVLLYFHSELSSFGYCGCRPLCLTLESLLIMIAVISVIPTGAIIISLIPPPSNVWVCAATVVFVGTYFLYQYCKIC